jgi:inorganic pyrophosphatase
MGDYKKLEPGKYEHVRIGGFGDKAEAQEVIQKGAEGYDKEN